MIGGRMMFVGREFTEYLMVRQELTQVYVYLEEKKEWNKW